MREMVIEALNRRGGVDYLTRQAESNPTAFLALVGKILPREIQAEHRIAEDLAERIREARHRVQTNGAG